MDSNYMEAIMKNAGEAHLHYAAAAWDGEGRVASVTSETSSLTPLCSRQVSLAVLG